MTSTDQRTPPGRVLGGRYRLLTRIGVGASASVYAAQDVALERYVAVKVLHAGLATDPKFVRRFRAEATATAALGHEHLVAVHDTGQDGAVVYLVQELLTGGSLRRLLDVSGPIDTSQALVVGRALGRGLAHAHAAGFVHRDIKPANVLFGSDGRLRIADFGIAKAVLDANRTETDAALGTARYAPPEQGLGGPIGPAADLYATALTLIDAVTGTVPLVADSAVATLVGRQGVDLPVPDEMGPLAPVLAEALRADPAARPPAATFVRQLTTAASGLRRPAPLPLPGLPRPTTDDTAAVAAVPVSPTTTPTPSGDEGTLVLGAGDAPTIDLRTASEEPRRRFGLAGALVVLLGFAIAGGLAWAWSTGRLTIEAGESEPEVPVVETFPVGDYVGRDVDRVLGEAGARGWRVDEVTERRDGTEPGEVLQQSPLPGTRLEEGGSLTLVVSEGSVLREVPELVAADRAVAEAALTSAGLEIGAVTGRFDESVPAGVVLEAGIAAGTEVETGTAVDMVVSDGPEPRLVAPVAGLPVAEAVAALEELGLTVTTVREPSETVELDHVISVTPAAGTSLARGDGVELTVSDGLPFIEVPNVVGTAAAAAAEQLGAAGFVVVDTIGPPNGTVLATDPPAGEFHRKGTAIRIVTRLGAP